MVSASGSRLLVTGVMMSNVHSRISLGRGEVLHIVRQAELIEAPRRVACLGMFVGVYQHAGGTQLFVDHRVGVKIVEGGQHMLHQQVHHDAFLLFSGAQRHGSFLFLPPLVLQHLFMKRPRRGLVVLTQEALDECVDYSFLCLYNYMAVPPVLSHFQASERGSAAATEMSSASPPALRYPTTR
ncbi:hypothetical protein CCH79_00004574 [Gambusia affinis]|uniref:Uncharacterized protein n=1 Tax=Gambusia affinis TaxID=33528 RepID=A0A315UYI7_GAMAF|nr:hypothetical protein CCH79_00004574 [Gambusia affinis]